MRDFSASLVFGAIQGGSLWLGLGLFGAARGQIIFVAGMLEDAKVDALLVGLQRPRYRVEVGDVDPANDVALGEAVRSTQPSSQQ